MGLGAMAVCARCVVVPCRLHLTACAAVIMVWFSVVQYDGGCVCVLVLVVRCRFESSFHLSRLLPL